MISQKKIIEFLSRFALFFCLSVSLISIHIYGRKHVISTVGNGWAEFECLIEQFPLRRGKMGLARLGKKEFLVWEMYGKWWKAYILNRNFYDMVLSFYAWSSQAKRNAVIVSPLNFFTFSVYCVLLTFAPACCKTSHNSPDDTSKCWQENYAALEESSGKLLRRPVRNALLFSNHTY